MPIVTNFAFDHYATVAEAHTAAAAPDLLGLLRGFVGTQPAAKPAREWKGRGYNMLWRPHHGTPDHFLQLMHTDETLAFVDISGKGIANRGFAQDDIALGGTAYTQAINDHFDGSGQHFEPGVWIRVPPTADPKEPESVARMGSIPHGTTINLQGAAADLGAVTMSSRIGKSSIVPFVIGSPDDGVTGLIPFPDTKLSFTGATRTPLARVPGLTQEQLDDPNIFLLEANAGLTFTEVVEIKIGFNVKPKPGPDVGGGVDNIAFLEGNTLNGENGVAPAVSATFWIQKAKDRQGAAIVQLQYTQRVLLNFNKLSWPHVTVGTLRPV